MNDSNNFPRNSKNNDKLPEGWGKANNDANDIFSASKNDTKTSPWENKPQATAWENSPKTSAWENSPKAPVWGNSPKTPAWGNTNNSSANRSSKPQGINTENVNEAINKFAGMAKRAGEKAVNAATDAAKNAADYAKSDAVSEKMNAAKNKAQALASGAGSKLSDIKNKASDKISEHKNKVRPSDENISAADEYDTEEDLNISSGETVDQNGEENAHITDVPIASDNASIKDDTNETSSPVTVGEIKNEEPDKSDSAGENISAADEYDTAEDLNISSGETVYQNGEENAHITDDPIASDNATIKDDTNETSLPDPVREKEARSQAAPPFAPQNRNNQQTQRPDSQSQRAFPQTQRPASQSQRAFPQAQRPASQPQSPVPSQSSAPGYVVQTQKTNPFLIIVIIVLVLIVGVLGGMFFMTNRKDNNSGKNDMYEEPTEGTQPASSDTSSENETQLPTETSSQQEDIPSDEQIMQAVKKAMRAHLDSELSKEQTDNFHYFDRDVKYALYDVNADGIDELFFSYHNVESIGSDLYVYKNGEYVKIYEFYTGAKICLSEQLLQENVYGGGEMTKIHILAENELLQKDELSQLYGNGATFYHNDLVITESEYNQLKSTYDSMKWIYVPDNSRPFSVMVDMSNYASKDKIPSAYKGYENIDNAPEDMEFYDVNKTVKGYVKTESTGLNMRAGAGTDYKVTHEIPRGAEVEILGANSEWYYVKYFTGGAGAFAVDFYGFVSSQFISTTPVVIETVNVYSCKSLGRLNTGGLGVAGFATSYVVDGGEVSEVRHTLGDGWHVTAVNWCYSRDILWYELYDSDDGDYYGWVDAEYIDFY